MQITIDYSVYLQGNAVQLGDAGADALTMGNQFGALLASWFPTGLYTIPGVPPIGPLPWI